jgi:O-antigen/teichoic acid export membrane protein
MRLLKKPNFIKYEFALNVGKLMSGTMLAQALGVIITPILTRFFLPEHFGVSSVFISYCAMIGTVVCLKYEMAIVIPDNDDDSANILGLSLLLVVCISAMIALLVIPFDDFWAKLLNNPKLQRYLIWMPVMVAASGTTMAFNFWLNRYKAFGQNSMASVLNSLTTQGFKLGAAVAGVASGGALILAAVIGQCVSAIFLAMRFNRVHAVALGSIRFTKMTALASRFRHFPLYASGAALLNTASQQLPVVFMAFFFEPAVVGYYAFGVGILSLPMSLITSAVSRVFYQKACEIRHSNGRQISSDLYQTLFTIGFFPFATIIFHGEMLFATIFGENWGPAGVYAQFIAVWSLFVFSVRPLTMTIAVYELQRIGLVLQSLLFILRLGSVYIGAFFNNALLAVALFSLTGAVHYFCTGLWYIHIAGGSVRRTLVATLPAVCVGSLLLILQMVFTKAFRLEGLPFFLNVAVALPVYIYAVRNKIRLAF